MSQPLIKEAVLRQAFDAAMPVRRTVGDLPNQPAEIIELAQGGFRGGYRLVYIASAGCGESHDYNNLRRADALPGVTLQYVNLVYPGRVYQEKGQYAPGQSLDLSTQGQAINWLGAHGMAVFDSRRAVLISPSDDVVRVFTSSQTQNFVGEVAGTIRQHQQRSAMGRT